MGTPRYVAKNPKLDDFIRPDGSVDTDSWLLALGSAEFDGVNVNSPEQRRRTDALRSQMKNYTETTRARAQPRVAEALAGAPIAPDIRSLARGSTAVPVDPEEAALEHFMRPRPTVGEGFAPPVDTGYPAQGDDLRAIKGSGSEPVSAARAPVPSENTTSIADLARGSSATVGTPGRAVQLEDEDPFALRTPLKKEPKKELLVPVQWEYEDPLTQLANVDPARMEKLRKSAGSAVSAMNADAAEADRLLALDRDANNLERAMEGGDRAPAKQALAKFKAARAPAKRLETGASMSPAPERPSFGPLPTEDQLAAPASPAPSKRTPLAIASSMATGAAPDTTADEKELADAAEARDAMLLAAQAASQGGHYADVMGGTQTGDRGASVRAAAGNRLGDVKAKQQLRIDARSRQQADEDRALDREMGLEGLASKRAKAQQDADFNDGASEKSRRARALAVALYPDLVKRIPPAEWQKMSAADVQMLLGEAVPPKLAGSGAGKGGGLSGAQLNSVRNKLPQHLVDTYNGINRVKKAAAAIGGWGKASVGFPGSLVPSLALSKEQQQLRQEAGGVIARFLQAGGGKSITAQEREILIGSISADPNLLRADPGMIERGLQIIERAMAADTRQSLAGVPEGDKAKLLGDMQIDPAWVGQDLSQSAVPTQQKRRIARNTQTGERRYINPDGSLGEVVK